jgi:hypothetical protein
VSLPAVQVRLGFFEALEAKSSEWRSLSVTDCGFHFAFAIGILNATGHGRGTVMLQHIAIEGIESGIVEVGQ